MRQDISCISSSTLSSLSLERIYKISPPRWNCGSSLHKHNSLVNSVFEDRELKISCTTEPPSCHPVSFRVFTNRGILSHIFALSRRKQIFQRVIGLRRLDKDILLCRKRIIPEPQYYLYIGHMIVLVKRFKRITV